MSVTTPDDGGEIDRIRIYDYEAEEIVGTVRADGSVQTGDTAVRDMLEEMAGASVDGEGDGEAQRGVEAFTAPPPGEDGARSLVSVLIPPGSPSFLRAVRDSLASPYRVYPEDDRRLPDDIDFDAAAESEDPETLEAEIDGSLHETSEKMSAEMLADSVFEFIANLGDRRDQ